MKQIPGDFGGLKIRFSGDRIIASSLNAVTTEGRQSEKEAVQKCLELLLKNIDSIQIIAEKNAENICTTPDLMRVGHV